VHKRVLPKSFGWVVNDRSTESSCDQEQPRIIRESNVGAALPSTRSPSWTNIKSPASSRRPLIPTSALHKQVQRKGLELVVEDSTSKSEGDHGHRRRTEKSEAGAVQRKATAECFGKHQRPFTSPGHQDIRTTTTLSIDLSS
jgi:hypothetical protein